MIYASWNNMQQCWRCKHREGTAIALDENGKRYAFPICSVNSGTIMNEVYYMPCPRRELGDGTKKYMLQPNES